MKFVLTMKCDNAAFCDDRDEGTAIRDQEVGRILREAADAVESGRDVFPLRDANGNHVGTAQFFMD